MRTHAATSVLAIVVFIAGGWLHAAPGSACECIVSGQTLSGRIDFAGQTNCYSFWGRAGQGIVVQMADSSAGLFGPRLRLYDPEGLPIEDCPSGGDLAKIDLHRVEKSGLYTIVASDSAGVYTGDYGLSLVLAPGATTSLGDRDGGDMTSGGARTGNISPAGDTDAYAFYGEPNHAVVITMADNSASGLLAPHLRLYDPDGLQVKDWPSGGEVAQFEYPIQKRGMHTIVASDAVGGATGEYGLSVHLAPPIDPCGVYPYDPQPPDGNAVGACNADRLSWSAVDGATGYDILFAGGSCTAPEKLAQNIAEPYLQMPALDENTVYYWQVVAHTAAGDVAGPVWWFAANPCPCGLTVSVIGRGSTDHVAGVFQEYPCGETVPVTATADPNFKFVRWEGSAVDANKVIVDYEGPRESRAFVTIDDNYALTAVFEESVGKLPSGDDSLWTADGQWAWGTPTGQGGGTCVKYGNPDPVGGQAGQEVFGVNLNGDYDTAVGGPHSLVAGPFDLRDYEDIRLTFWRWLNTDDPEYVTAAVDVSIDAQQTWRNLWKSETQIADSRWVFMEYPLGVEADGQAQVYVRWTYQIVKERAYPYSGWNLDGIELIGHRERQ